MRLKVLQFFALFRLDLQSDLTAAVQELTDLLEVLKYLKSANPLQIQHKADKCAQDSHDSPIFAIFAASLLILREKCFLQIQSCCSSQVPVLLSAPSGGHGWCPDSHTTGTQG